MKKLISVFGSSEIATGSAEWQLAEALGTALGTANFAVVTGGYGGTMEAASRGAHAAQATVIGVTAEVYAARGIAPNPYVTKEIEVKSAIDRLMELIDLADGYCALNNSPGTMLEVLTAWEFMRKNFTLQKPFVLLGADWFDLERYFNVHTAFESFEQYFSLVATPAAAAEIFLDRLGAERKLPDLTIL